MPKKSLLIGYGRCKARTCDLRLVEAESGGQQMPSGVKKSPVVAGDPLIAALRYMAPLGVRCPSSRTRKGPA